MADSRSEFEQEALVKAQEEKTIVHARHMARLAQVFEIGALVLTVVGVIAVVIIMVNGGRDTVGIGLAILVGVAAVGATLWAVARGMRLFGEYVALRIWRYPRRIATTAVPTSTPASETPTQTGFSRST